MQLRRAVGDSWKRVRDGAWSAGQCGLGAASAWAISTELLDHPRPFFAPVAAVVALGIGGGGRLVRTAELAVGVALGVAIGDAWVGLFGQGIWQVGVVVTLALLVAVAINGGGLAVTQSAIQAVFVVALPRTPHGGLHRWQDALVGGGVALAVAALLPADPWAQSQRLARQYCTELAAILHATASAFRRADHAGIAEQLVRGRALTAEQARWQEALRVGRETARLSPFRRGGGPALREGQRLATGLERATGNLRVLIRRLISVPDLHGSLPARLPDLLEDLVRVVALMPEGDAALAPLSDLAAQLDPAALQAVSLPAQVAIGQLRVAVVDLLEALGIDPQRARAALPALAT